MKWTPKWLKLPILDFMREVYAREDDPDTLAKWVLGFTRAITFGNRESECELANSMLIESMEYYRKKSEAGRKGGVASTRARGLKPKFESGRIPPPRSFDEVVAFVETQGLDYDDARLWWQRNFVERPGCDKDGVVFDNWKGALVNACRAESKKRKEKEK